MKSKKYNRFTKTKRKELKHTTKENYKTTKGKSERKKQRTTKST